MADIGPHSVVALSLDWSIGTLGSAFCSRCASYLWFRSVRVFLWGTRMHLIPHSKTMKLALEG
jgi:hypothetical protein